MLALRSLARSAPRIASRQALRSFGPIQPFAYQPLATSRIGSSVPLLRLAFSSYGRRLQGNEDELVVKLQSEIQIEEQDDSSEAKQEQAQALESWRKDNGWEISDIEGQEEVILTKSGNGETIRVTFSIDDINNEPLEEDEAFEEDQALEDEPVIANQQADAQAAAKSRNIRVAPEDELETEAEDLDEGGMREQFPAKVSINITKDGKPGALVIEGVTQYGMVNFEEFYYFEDDKVSQPISYDAEAKRIKAYAGPPFGTLDVELADLLQQYLADRGINEALAGFVTEYIEYKEAREYQRWLGNLKTFFE